MSHRAVGLTLSGSDGKTVSTGNFGHRLPPEGPKQDLDTLVLLKVLNAQLSILVAPKGDQTTPFYEATIRLLEILLTHKLLCLCKYHRWPPCGSSLERWTGS